MPSTVDMLLLPRLSIIQFGHLASVGPRLITDHLMSHRHVIGGKGSSSHSHLTDGQLSQEMYFDLVQWNAKSCCNSFLQRLLRCETIHLLDAGWAASEVLEVKQSAACRLGNWQLPTVAFGREELAHDDVEGAFRESMDIVRCFRLTKALYLRRARLREERGASVLQTLQLLR